MGAHPDDRDSVTDMTFLMFTCKAGAAGVGDGTMAAKVNLYNYFRFHGFAYLSTL